MCGIGGILSKNSQEVPEKALQQMALALAHRGPDDSGLFFSKNHNVGLAHRRLAIIDLSPEARQPMSSQDGSAHLVFNGEIYNYETLRENLKKNYPFRTHSDTEVVLALYEQQPSNFLHALRGMFAFGLWDESRQTLLLARDRMGMKPIYYAETEHFFLFASEVRAILKTGLVNGEFSPQAFSGYLSFGSVPAPHTMIQAIKLLPPATQLLYKNGRFDIKSYWNFPLPESQSHDPFHPEALREKLADTVKSHLVSDVPVGVFLSGGTDSTAITALMRMSTSGDIQSFSISFPGYPLDEAPYARLAAETFETTHREIPVTANEFLNSLAPIFAGMDQPTVDGVNTFFVSKLTREAGVKVALSGLGGDELFAGYPSFRLIPTLCRSYQWMQKIPAGKTFARFLASTLPSAKRQTLTEFLESDGTPEAAFFAVRRLFLDREKRALLSPDFRHQAGASFDPLQYLKTMTHNGKSTHDFLQAATLLESRGYMHNQLLRDTDVMGMAHGVEVRVPLVDHELIEHVNRIPAALKLTAQPKKLLIDALEGKLPTAIYQRKKMGFTFPFAAWMKNELRPALNNFFREGPAPVTKPYWNWPAAQKNWNEFLQGRLHWSRPWAIFAMENWLKLNL